jgi:AhpD family alkylhydroperoxidase
VGGRCAELKNHMTTDYLELRNHLEERLTQFGHEMPGPMSGFARLHKKAMEDGALSAKVKELMALAISIAVGCEGCIAYHTYDAIQVGATRPELLETISVGVMMAGGPGTIYAAHALDAVEQLLAEPPAVGD